MQISIHRRRALARSFSIVDIVDPDLKYPGSKQWQRDFAIVDHLL
jgi:hypothetical protein